MLRAVLSPICCHKCVLAWTSPRLCCRRSFSRDDRSSKCLPTSSPIPTCLLRKSEQFASFIRQSIPDAGVSTMAVVTLLADHIAPRLSSVNSSAFDIRTPSCQRHNFSGTDDLTLVHTHHVSGFPRAFEHP